MKNNIIEIKRFRCLKNIDRVIEIESRARVKRVSGFSTSSL